MGALLNLVALGGAGLGIAAFVMVLGLKNEVKELQEKMKGEEASAE